MKTIYSYGIEQKEYNKEIYKSCIYIVMRCSNFSRRNIRKKTVVGDKFYIKRNEKSVEALFDTDITANTKIKVGTKWKCMPFKKIDYYGIMDKYPKDYEYFDKLSSHFKQYLETAEFEIDYKQYEKLNKFIVIDSSEVNLCLSNAMHLLNDWTINEILEYIINYKDQNKEEKMKDFMSYIYLLNSNINVKSSYILMPIFKDKNFEIKYYKAINEIFKDFKYYFQPNSYIVNYNKDKSKINTTNLFKVEIPSFDDRYIKELKEVCKNNLKIEIKKELNISLRYLNLVKISELKKYINFKFKNKNLNKEEIRDECCIWIDNYEMFLEIKNKKTIEKTNYINDVYENKILTDIIKRETDNHLKTKFTSLFYKKLNYFEWTNFYELCNKPVEQIPTYLLGTNISMFKTDEFKNFIRENCIKIIFESYLNKNQILNDKLRIPRNIFLKCFTMGIIKNTNIEFTKNYAKKLKIIINFEEEKIKKIYWSCLKHGDLFKDGKKNINWNSYVKNIINLNEKQEFSNEFKKIETWNSFKTFFSKGKENKIMSPGYSINENKFNICKNLENEYINYWKELQKELLVEIEKWINIQNKWYEEWEKYEK